MRNGYWTLSDTEHAWRQRVSPWSRYSKPQIAAPMHAHFDIKLLTKDPIYLPAIRTCSEHRQCEWKLSRGTIGEEGVLIGAEKVEICNLRRGDKGSRKKGHQPLLWSERVGKQSESPCSWPSNRISPTLCTLRPHYNNYLLTNTSIWPPVLRSYSTSIADPAVYSPPEAAHNKVTNLLPA